jgi:DNA-binding transcriptional MerR regulator
MRINQVQQLVGITKKNIRFYEQQGLLAPARDRENGYREYSDSDIDTLCKIKLLRKLSIPIDEIRKLQSGIITLDDCMRRHKILIEREEKNLAHIKLVCDRIECSGSSLGELETNVYLDAIDDLEKEGAQFMDVKNSDTRKLSTGAIIAASVAIVLLAAIDGLFIWANTVEPIPIWLLIIFIAVPAAVAVGVIVALVERLKEIKKGEIDEASKY